MTVQVYKNITKMGLLSFLHVAGLQFALLSALSRNLGPGQNDKSQNGLIDETDN